MMTQHDIVIAFYAAWLAEVYRQCVVSMMVTDVLHLLDLWGWQYFHTVHFDVCVGPLLWRYLQWIIFKLGVQTNVWICPDCFCVL